MPNYRPYFWVGALVAVGIANPLPAAAQTSSLATAVVKAIPTMNRSAFLPTLNNESKRNQLWQLFRSAENSAKTFATAPDRFVVLRRVELGRSGAALIQDGVITFSPDGEPGPLFYLIFDSIFTKSGLNAGKDRTWNNAFGDAFRYVTERELLKAPPSEWARKIERYRSMSFDEVAAKDNDKNYDRTYAYPTSLLIKRAGGTTAGLRTLWLELNAARAAKGTDVLDDFFGFDLAHGKMMAKIPTMDRSAFLPSLGDESKRSEYWDKFRAAERSAKTFASAPDRFVVLHSVQFENTAPKWISNGDIKLPPNSDMGTMFHEVFHTVYSKSELHSGKDKAWNEAFCDAFRYFTERELLPGPPSEWSRHVEEYRTKSLDEIVGTGKRDFYRVYTYPASIIVKSLSSEGSTAALRALWFNLQAMRAAKGTDVLDDYFGYDLASGNMIPVRK